MRFTWLDGLYRAQVHGSNETHLKKLTVRLLWRFNLNFHPLEVVSRWRDPQLQGVKIIQISQKGGQLFSNLADWCDILSLTCLKGGSYCANKKWKPEHIRRPAVNLLSARPIVLPCATHTPGYKLTWVGIRLCRGTTPKSGQGHVKVICRSNELKYWIKNIFCVFFLLQESIPQGCSWHILAGEPSNTHPKRVQWLLCGLEG